MANPTKTVADLKPNPRNPRKITDAKLKMLAKAMDKFGDLGGVVFNRRSGQLIGGHQRTKAVPKSSAVVLDKRYDKPTVAGTVAEGHIAIKGERFAYREVDWDEATEKAANLAANKGAGEFDMPQVAEWIGELDTGDFDMDLTMFDADELVPLSQAEHVFNEVKEDDSDGVAAATTNILPGQIYVLGEHRLMCGDSTHSASVQRLMDGELANLIFTDPPYNLAGAGDTSAAAIRSSYAALRDSKWDTGFDFLSVAQNLQDHLAKDCSVFVCTSHYLAGDIWAWMAKWADFHGYCIWIKPSPMPSLHKRHWTWAVELVCYATRGKHVFNFPTAGHALNYWNIERNPGGNSVHPTMKPTALPAHAISHSSNQGQIVLDLFGGAGSTLLACEGLKRRARLMELNPLYCQVIVDRWEKLTGQKAELLSSGTDGGGQMEVRDA